MDLDTFVIEAEKVLHDAGVLNEENRETIFTEFYRPLNEKQRFKVGFKNKLALAHGETSGPEVRLNLTVEHGALYLETLVKRLRAYGEQIRHNKAVSLTYQMPVFESDQAREFAQETLEESFQSYSKVASYVLCGGVKTTTSASR